MTPHGVEHIVFASGLIMQPEPLISMTPHGVEHDFDSSSGSSIASVDFHDASRR